MVLNTTAGTSSRHILSLIGAVLAIPATATSMVLIGYVGWHRGGSLESSVLGMLIGVIAVLAAHLMPACCRALFGWARFWAVLVWLASVAFSAYSHVGFFLMTQQQAGQVRAAAVDISTVNQKPARKLSEVLAEGARIQADLNRAKAALAAIKDTECSEVCMRLRGKGAGLSSRLQVLEAEAEEIRHWVNERALINAQRKEVSADSVAFVVSNVLGLTQEGINLVAALLVAFLLEGAACVGWVLLIWVRDSGVPQSAPEAVTASTQEPTAPESLVTDAKLESRICAVVQAVNAGELSKVTVTAVQAYCGCGRGPAGEIARQAKLRLDL